MGAGLFGWLFGCTAATSQATGGAGAASGSTSASGAQVSAATGVLPALPCNPVTNAGCNSGKACDVHFDMVSGKYLGFGCFPPGVGDGVKPCDACEPHQNKYCAVGMTCDSLFFPKVGKCTHYCCNNLDCGGGGFCGKTTDKGDLFPDAPGLGLCVDNTAMAATCNSPATSPSKGTCVTVTGT